MKPLLLAAIGLTLAGAAGAARAQDPPPQDPPAQQPRATFRTAVDLVPVDVNVIDREGRPIDDLTAADFALTVDGRARRIASAEFIRLGGDPGPPPERPEYYSTNAQAAGGRLVMLIVDQGNISAGRGKHAIDAATRFVAGLAPSDRVGLFAIPGAGPQINFTANHALVLTSLRNIVGQRSPDLGRQRVGIAEAVKLDRGDQFTLNAIIDRECPGATGPDREICIQDLGSEARTLYAEMRDRTRNSIVSLKYIMERLAANSSPKTVVYIGEGLVIDREMSDLIWIAPLAEKGRVALYVLQIEPPLVDAGAPRVSPTRSEDIALAEEGLSVMAGLARGTVFRVVASADYAFSRLSREMSGYYLLSFEPEAGDRDGQPHKIRIQVPGRKGIDVRARQEFRVAPAHVTTDEAVVADIIRAPLLATDIGLKVSTYTLREANTQKLRILLAVDIDRSQNPSGQLALGYALADANGRLIASQYEPDVKLPVRPTGTQHYVGAMAADNPGVYVLKLAVIDDAGKRGSVEHAFQAQLASAGQIRATDLLIAETSGGPRGLTPAVAADFVADELSGYVELYSDSAEALNGATVTLEVADKADSRPLDSVPARFSDTGGTPTRRVAEGRIPIALLPPGDYVARAVIAIGGRKAGQVTRPFRVSRPVRALTAPGAGAALKTPGSTIPFVSRTELFERSAVLTPQVVGFFLDRLNVGNRGLPPAAALDHARAGRFEEAFDAARANAPAQLSTVFLAGLALYAKGDLEAAAVKFRETIRLDSEFFPAAFYLGACYAAGGRDRDAAAAWQTSLVTESDAPFIYTLLGDALLRQRAVDQAVDILTEAATLWPGDEQVQLRLGTALALSGKPAEALQTLDPYLARHPEDHERHFVALRTIYEAHAAGQPIASPEEDRARFERYATAYAAARGPQQELVERWRRFLRK